MKKTTHILLLIAIFLVSMVAQPAFAASPKKGKKKAKPELARVGNKYYAGKEEMKGKQVLEFYAQQNCQEAYNQFKTGRNCYISGWTLLGAGAGMTVIGLGCVIGGVVNTLGGAMGAMGDAVQGGDGEGGIGRMNSGKSTTIAGAVLIGIGAAAQIACGPLIVVGRKKMYQSVDLYNVTCRKRAQVQPYWSIQTSNNGLGFAVNF